MFTRCDFLCMWCNGVWNVTLIWCNCYYHSHICVCDVMHELVLYSFWREWCDVQLHFFLHATAFFYHMEWVVRMSMRLFKCSHCDIAVPLVCAMSHMNRFHTLSMRLWCAIPICIYTDHSCTMWTISQNSMLKMLLHAEKLYCVNRSLMMKLSCGFLTHDQVEKQTWGNIQLVKLWAMFCQIIHVSYYTCFILKQNNWSVTQWF